MNEFDYFLKDRISKFIAQELAKGYSLHAIKNVLISHGHHPDMIEYSIQSLEDHHFYQQKKTPPKNLEKDAIREIKKMIREYTHNQSDIGYSLDEIKKSLNHHGHSLKLIEEALNEKENKFKQKKGFVHEIFIINIIALLAIIAFTSISTNESLLLVALGFLPSITNLFLVDGFFDKLKSKEAVFAYPIVVLIFYVIIGMLLGNMLEGMSLINLLIFNLILSLLTSISYYYWNLKHKTL